MTRILIPVEDITYGEAQVDFLARHEFPEQTEITVMTVLKPLPVQDYGFAVPAAYLEAIMKEDETAARKLLDHIEKQLKEKFPQLKVKKVMEMGAPGGEIVREAKEGEYDWIIMGSHGRTGLDKFFLGSISQAVTNHAHCSVTIVRLPEASKKQKESDKKTEARMVSS